MTEKINDEYYVDLLKIVKNIWDQKLIIFITISLSIISLIIYHNNQRKNYESRIFIKFDILPAFYEHSKVLSDLKKLFYEKKVFDGWVKSVNNKLISFDDFDNTIYFKGSRLSKPEADQLAYWSSKKKLGNYLLIKSNDPQILEAFYNYSTYVSRLLTNEYSTRAKEELQMIGKQFKNFSTSNHEIFSTFLEIDRYLTSAEKGDNVLMISHPTIPINTDTSLKTKILFTLILSAITGYIIALILDGFRNKKL